MQRALLLALVVAGTGCSLPTSLTVDLRTDFVPGIEFTTVRTISANSYTAGIPPEGRAQDHAVAVGDPTDAPVRVASFDGVSVGQSYVVIELLDAHGAVVAMRPVAITVAASLTVTVVMTRDCHAVTCPRGGDPTNATACFGGRCVDPGCGGNGSCGTPTCTGDGDCTGGSACTTGHCVDGACFYGGGTCPTGDYCSPMTGCEPVVPVPDAGTADAGTVDASDVDAAAVDAGPTDAGSLDGGALDASALDAGALDASAGADAATD